MASLPNLSPLRIVIVGAGAAGLACAWQLAKAGHDVTLVDRGEVGKGALWASGGMLAAGFEASAELDETHELSAEFAGLLSEGLDLWPHWIGELAQFSRTPLGFNLDGSITPLYGAQDVARSEQVLAQAEGVGVEARRLTGAELARLEPGLAVADAAIHFARDGQLDNRALGPALAAAVLSAGGRIEMRRGVRALARSAGVITGVVMMDGQILNADLVLLTTGTGAIEGAPSHVATRPVKGQMLAFDGITARAPTHVIRGFSIYLCAKPGGRLIVGATVEPDTEDLSTTSQACDSLVVAARRVMPVLDELEPVGQWSGLRPAARDLMPVVGEVEPGLLVAGGGYRNGVLLAPVMAEAITRLVAAEPAPAIARYFAPHRDGLRARRDH